MEIRCIPHSGTEFQASHVEFGLGPSLAVPLISASAVPSDRSAGLPVLSLDAYLCPARISLPRSSERAAWLASACVGGMGGTHSLLHDIPAGIGIEHAHRGCHFRRGFSQILLEQHAILVDHE